MIRVIDVLDNVNNVKIPVYLKRDTGTFYSIWETFEFEDNTYDGIKGKLKEYICNRENMQWSPVIDVKVNKYNNHNVTIDRNYGAWLDDNRRGGTVLIDYKQSQLC